MMTLVLLKALASVPTGCEVKNMAFSYGSCYYVAFERDGCLDAVDGCVVLEEDEEEP
tara:strand:- start:220 stop:390 length:171 start_codon:yes stop_codon:yes gene_type:complete